MCHHGATASSEAAGFAGGERAHVQLIALEELAPQSKASGLHCCIFRGDFTLSFSSFASGGDVTEVDVAVYDCELKSIIASCLLIRGAYIEILPPCVGYHAALSCWSRPDRRLHVVDALLVGRRLNEKKKASLVKSLFGSCGSIVVDGVDHSVVSVWVLADLRQRSQQDERDGVTYFALQQFSSGISGLVKEYAYQFSKRSFIDSSTSSGHSDNATTILDFDRCFLACSLALIRPGNLVLDPFAGACSLTTMAAALFGATVFSSDIIQCSSTRPSGGGYGSTEVLSCLASALTTPWTNECFDAIVCDPPYGIRTGLLSVSGLQTRVVDSPVRALEGSISLSDVLLLGDRLLRRGGRLTFWWYCSSGDVDPASCCMCREPADDANLPYSGCSASDPLPSSINAVLTRYALSLQLLGVAYDDLGMGKSLPCGQSSNDVSENDGPTMVWRRCLIVLGKRVAYEECALVPNQQCNEQFIRRRIENYSSRRDSSHPSQELVPQLRRFQAGFFKACWTGNLQQLKLIVGQLSSEKVDDSGDSSRQYPATFTPEFAALLLCNFLKDEKGNTPIIVAAGFGRTQCVEYLLAKGADLRIRGTQQCTALMRSCRFGHVETTRALLHHALKHGGNMDMLSIYEELCIQAVDSIQFSALAYAVAFDHVCLMPLFPKKVLTDLSSESLGSAMHIIARWNCVKVYDYFVKEILGSVSSIAVAVQAFHLEGTTPLHMAAKYGHRDMMNRLVASGADIHSTDNSGRTAEDIWYLWHGPGNLDQHV
jgi:ankyrin repeat protein